MSYYGGEVSSSARLVSGTEGETESLLHGSQSRSSPTGSAGIQDDAESRNPRTFVDDVPDAKRQLGLLSAISLIFNRVVGTGVFAAPSIILNSSGSVGMTFVMWILGALVATAGTAVYVEFGTGLPRSGGDKIYLEYIYRHPAFMDYLCCCGIWGVHLDRFICMTFCPLVHGIFLNFGLRLQNILGAFKLLVLVLLAGSGLFSLVGVPGFSVGEQYEQPNNFTWNTFWEGSNFGANAFVTGMYNVTWSYIGYSNANYALSEVRDPVRTIKRAAPLAMILVAFVYFSVNVAYFAVISKADMLGEKFPHVWDLEITRALSVVIALSVLGNILAILFAQCRLVQELGREGILPYSSFFASNKPFDTPLAGLSTQYLSSVLLMAFAPAGDAYLFLVNYTSYPLVLVSLFVSGGLLLLYTPPFKSYNWDPPFRAHKYAVVFFFLSNVFLAAVPVVPPSAGSELYEHLPLLLYWFIAFKWIPGRNGYKLKQGDSHSR
ncbi:APC amino acid permease [Melanogaster broomeanus]|nr:APC amino acid permease [Melanogaster broomeanus]